MLDRNEPISSEVQDEAGSTPGGTMPGMGASTTVLAELLAELLAEVRRQTGILERAHREREREPRALLSKREAARLLGVSRGRTLDALLASGQVRAVRIGGRLRVPITEIERLQADGLDGLAPTAHRAGQRKQSASAINEALKRRGF